MYRIIVALVVCRLVTFSAFAASEPSYSSSMARRGMASSGDKMLKPARSATTVDLSIARGGYAALRFALRSGDAGLTEIRIQFGDGSVRAEHGALAFGRNRQTVPISFASGNDAGDRFIDRVSVGYHAKGRSTIEVWGIQTPKGATMLRTEGPYAATPAELETAARKTQLQKAVDSVDLKAETTSARAWKLLRRLQDGKLDKNSAEYRSLEQSGAEQIAGSSGLARELQHLRDDIEAAQYISPDETNAYETNIAQLANKIENERTSLDQFEERIPSELHAWNGDTWRLDRPSPNCAFLAICTPVSIFFGTDRAQEKTPERIEFSWDSGAGLSLGKAIVTVPKANRTKGEVNRPSWWDLLKFRNPWGEDPARHFTIPPGGVTVFARLEDFVAAVKQHAPEAGTFKDDAFVFVHGYNTSFDDQKRSASKTFQERSVTRRLLKTRSCI